MDDASVYRAYPELLDQLVAILRPLAHMPLEQMRVANERMQTLAPFFAAPITYHAGAQNLVDQRKVIDAAAAVQAVILGLPGAPRSGGERLGSDDGPEP